MMKFKLYYLTKGEIKETIITGTNVKEIKKAVNAILLFNNALQIGCEYVGS